MSILTSRAKSVAEVPTDEIYVIYGNNGTGKTTLAATFPHTKEKPMLYLDFLEGGTGSIRKADQDNIIVIPISDFKELDEVLTDVLNGYTVDNSGAKIPVQYSTIVFDSATQMEFLMKKFLMESDKKDEMNLKLWGQAKQEHDTLWNLCKLLHQETGSKIVVICLQKEISDEENPGNNKIIPNLMNSAAYGLCAKASFVWYTKIEAVDVKDETTGKMVKKQQFVTYIGACQAYLTKTRKPPEIEVPLKAKNLTYAMFKKHVLDKINQK